MTSPAGPRCRTAACSRRRAGLSGCARSPAGRRTTPRARLAAGGAQHRRHRPAAVPAGRLPGQLAAGGRARRPDRVAEVAAAEMVLRRARQRAVRQDHPAGRVLPDPGRAVDPERRGGADRGGQRRGHAGRARLRVGRQDPAAARRAAGRAARCAATSRSTSARPPWPARARRTLAAYPGLAVRPVVSDFEEHLGLPAGDGRRLVAFLGSTIGNLVPAQRAAFLASAARQAARRRCPAARHRPGQGPGRAGAPPTTTTRASPRRSTRTSSRCSTPSSAPTSTRMRSSTWRSGIRPPMDRDAAALRVPAGSDAARHRAARSPSMRARRCGPRCRPNSAASAWPVSWPARASRCGPGGPTRRASSACRCQCPAELQVPC